MAALAGDPGARRRGRNRCRRGERRRRQGGGRAAAEAAEKFRFFLFFSEQRLDGERRRRPTPRLLLLLFPFFFRFLLLFPSDDAHERLQRRVEPPGPRGADVHLQLQDQGVLSRTRRSKTVEAFCLLFFPPPFSSAEAFTSSAAFSFLGVLFSRNVSKKAELGPENEFSTEE